MAWRETGIMDERFRFIADCLDEAETMTDLRASYGISRKTGCKWRGRYADFGPEGLRDLTRAPLTHGRATAALLVEQIVAEKEAHPLWGPQEDCGASGAARARPGLARYLDGGRDSQAARSCQGALAGALESRRQWPLASAGPTQRSVERRPQGLVPHG